MNRLFGFVGGVLLFIALSTVFISCNVKSEVSEFSDRGEKKPIIVVTDAYHPYQDPGDNFDLIMGYALPEVDLKAVILDITDAFRKPVADHATLWNDPRGPREAGIIPVMQLNYIFDKNIPFAVGPLTAMESTTDKMQDIPEFQQEGMNLLLQTLRESKKKVEILSFGSARSVAVAYNRAPSLFKEKVEQVHLSAGTDSPDFELGEDQGANAIPGGEWNVALDVNAFIRLLRSDLPVNIYPCAAKDGAFVAEQNNTYWELPDLHFIQNMDEQLQRYLAYAFQQKKQHDFLREMDVGELPDSSTIANNFPSPHHVWETSIWLQVAGRKLIGRDGNNYKIISAEKVKEGDKILSGHLRSCLIEVRDDGRFSYEFTQNKNTNFKLYHRGDPLANQEAFQETLPKLYKSFRIKKGKNHSFE